MGKIGRTETSLTKNPRCVTSQGNEDIIYATAKAWNHITISI